jgi:hypothetical protein
MTTAKTKKLDHNEVQKQTTAAVKALPKDVKEELDELVTKNIEANKGKAVAKAVAAAEESLTQSEDVSKGGGKLIMETGLTSVIHITPAQARMLTANSGDVLREINKKTGVSLEVAEDGEVKIKGDTAKAIDLAHSFILDVITTPGELVATLDSGTGKVIDYRLKRPLTFEERELLPKPWVIIDGVQIEPKATGLKLSGGRIVPNQTPLTYERDVYINYYGADSKDLTFTQFAVVINGRTVTVMLDEKSTLEVTNTYFGSERSDSDAAIQRNALVTLINSSSRNDSFFGDNLLIGLESTYSSYTDACVSKTLTGSYRAKTPPPIVDLPWDSRGASFGTDRNKVSHATFRQALIEGSILASGVYKNVQIFASTIKSEHSVTFENVSMDGDTIKAKSIVMKHTTTKGFRLMTDGPVLIVNARFKDVAPVLPGLYMPNKFCALQIDLPLGQLSMYRESKEKICLTVNSYISVVMNLDDDFDTIEEKVAELMTKSAGGWGNTSGIDPKDNDPLTRNLMIYVVAAIRSRIKVIKLLDSAIKVAETITATGRDDYYDQQPF